jgi:nicotinate-nucleotide adenylyltransferase
MKIGLFGGTFDPVHVGHLIIAETISSDFLLDRVFFIPAAVPPHKNGNWISPSDRRLEMLKLVIEDHTRFELSDVEIKRGGISYTIDTVRWFQESASWRGAVFYLIIGSDSLYDIKNWKHPEKILSSIQVLVIERPGFERGKIEEKYSKHVQWVSVPQMQISSTEIRKRVREKKSIRYWVPRKVETYIHDKGMYL